MFPNKNQDLYTFLKCPLSGLLTNILNYNFLVMPFGIVSKFIDAQASDNHVLVAALLKQL